MGVRGLMTSMTKFAARHISKPVRIRYKLSRIYLVGDGIEVGALHNPLPVSPKAKVKYVDRLPKASLQEQYPELLHQEIAAPDIIDNGEELSSIQNESLDFIIANHFIEHCENPIATIKNFFSKLKLDGIVYLAVPDKRFTFDNQRESTSHEHLENDYTHHGNNSRIQHYLDFARYSLLNNKGDELEVDTLAKRMMRDNYSIHFHVWTQAEFLAFMLWTKKHYLPQLDILEARSNQNEGIFILRKRA